MALYKDIALLRRNAEMVDRVSVAVTKIAQYIITAEVGPTNARVRWANNAIVNPDPVAQAMMAAVVSDTVVQDEGLLVSDAHIQYVVEQWVDRFADR